MSQHWAEGVLFIIGSLANQVQLQGNELEGMQQAVNWLRSQVPDEDTPTPTDVIIDEEDGVE